ncbi:MAG: DUF1559 domain-containing protein [Pirellulales bacterium]|nr:DUF1559 domain-containing protein [Pirellulales bacterium]
MDENPYHSPETDAHAEILAQYQARRRFRAALVILAVAVIILVLFILLLLPNVRFAREAARRSTCRNNLKQVALALHNYAEVYGALPPAYTTDASGQLLHSWRTLILPYMEMHSLYDSIDLTKPWDDPTNEAARASVVPFYLCPSASNKLDPTHTTYLAIVTPHSCLQANSPRRFAEITDGTAGTMVILEVDEDHAVHWMAPIDADEQLVLSLREFPPLSHPAGMHAAFADGSVHFLQADLPADQRRALISIAGNDQNVLEDWE